MTEANKEVVRRLSRAINSGDLADLDRVLAPDYVRHDPNPLMDGVGREGYKQAFTSLRRAFPDARWTLDELLSDGDRVMARWSFRGTHNAPFFNVPATGKEIRYPILAIYRIDAGLIAEDWHLFHSIGLWQELIPEIRDLIRKATG